MIVKEKFELLKNVPNILSLTESDLNLISVEAGPRKVFATLELLKNRISHFTKDRIFSVVSSLEKRERIHVVVMKDYLLPVSYNIPTKGIVLNLSYFHTADLSRINPRDVYALTTYGLTFYSLITRGSDILNDSYYSVITGFLHSVLVRLFAKEYGLLGIYSSSLSTMKFLLSCYILSSFFGISGEKAYNMSSTISVFNYRDIVDKLDKFDFSKIEDFIKSLSFFKVMPGIEKYKFTGKVVKFLGINFLAAFEDVSRFVSVLTCSNIAGSSIIPTFIFRYNENDFDRILTIVKSIY